MHKSRPGLFFTVSLSLSVMAGASESSPSSASELERLVRPFFESGGRYLQYPGYGKQGHRTIGNLYNTLMHAAGKPQDEFGQLDVNLDASLQRGPLPELLV